MKKIKMNINDFFGKSKYNPNAMFWYEGRGCVNVFRCRPTAMYHTRKAVTMVFGDIIIKMPVEKYWNRLVPNVKEWLTLKATGVTINVKAGDCEAATYNYGDPLPSRCRIESIEINGEPRPEYIDPWYPHYKISMESAIGLLLGVLEQYKEVEH